MLGSRCAGVGAGARRFAARGRRRAALGLRLGLQLRERAHGGDRGDVRRAVGHLDLLGALGLGRRASLESSPPLALPTANEAPNRTTAAAASASRVRPALTHSPSCAASWSPASCRRSAPRAGFRTWHDLDADESPCRVPGGNANGDRRAVGQRLTDDAANLEVPRGLCTHRGAGGGSRPLDRAARHSRRPLGSLHLTTTRAPFGTS